MSVDMLQKRIRKDKCPIVIELGVTPDNIPPHLLTQEGSYVKAHHRFCTELLEGLKGSVSAIRFRLAHFSLMGLEGMTSLFSLMEQAKKDYYIILDGPDSLTPELAQFASETALNWQCDALIVSPYIGSDSVKPFLHKLKQNDKALFITLRTPNKSASEIQDLMTGSRLVHFAAADIANRLGEELIGRSGYSQIAGVASANASDSLRQIRTKYNRLFLLVDGYDCANANAKNCSFAFDRLGHGAAVCAGSGVTAAWVLADDNGENFVQLAVEATERMKKNLLRYITIL